MELRGMFFMHKYLQCKISQRLLISVDLESVHHVYYVMLRLHIPFGSGTDFVLDLIYMAKWVVAENVLNIYGNFQMEYIITFWLRQCEW